MVRPAVTARTPICATCAEGLRRAPRIDAPRQNPPRPSARGFTLIELLVALAVAAFVAVMVPPALGRLKDSANYRDTVRQVLTELRMARQQALLEGRETRFAVDLPQRRYGLDPRQLHDLPQPLQMRVVVAGIEWSDRQVGAIRFMAQGGSTGGSIDVLRPQAGGVRIVVDWLSGGITQIPLPP
jgi:general secretion pathway protein H